MSTETDTKPKTPADITNWVDPKDKTGVFKRHSSQFRNFISNSPNAEFPPEKGRYHLYISYACPWAHRTLIVLKLKGLESLISWSSVHWEMGKKGWRFATKEDQDAPGENVGPDPVEGHEKYTHLQDIYFGVDPGYEGRWTVPVLFDKRSGKIVSNESSEIIRMFYSEFDHLLDQKHKDIILYPEDLRSQIDASNEWTYNEINNGVYKSGFATTQTAYESAVTTLFAALDRAEAHLAQTAGPFYYGARLTEADVRLYTTIIRFDAVYVQHFKTNLKDIRSGYPYLHKWVRTLYWDFPASFGRDTTEFTHIKRHYTKSHTQINPFSITPLGPEKPILEKDEEVPAVIAALAALRK